ncbi:hypothetical protein [Dyadobacter sp. CY347]|uniref:hypothetical protein n=1 Tax=Dyadobacter sp. CY347 TaxID=2909336 RepID=UPI001F3176C3|nr:hypothetical protein [Dyadobacter sp. CY347]MCF2487517.1 hypothetical protein [Dyadobacter sp. CY347]
MSNNLLKNVSDLPPSIVVELIASTIATAVVFLVTYLSKEILIRKVPELAEYELYIYLVWILLIVWLVLRFYLKVNAIRSYLPVLRPTFHILEKRIYHKFNAPDSVTHRRTFKLRCLKNDTRVFSDKFIWTGEKYDIRCLERRYQLVLTNKEAYYDTYEIRFDRLLSAGDEVEFTVEWECDNKSLSARPFFSTTILAPTDKLIMDLHLDSSLGVLDAALDVCHAEGETPRQTNAKSLDSGRATWELLKPSLMFHYKVRWIP